MTSIDLRTAGSGGRKAAALFMGLAFAAMFASSFFFRMDNPSLTERVEAPSSAMGQMNMAGPMKEIMELMQKLQENPNDAALMLEVAEKFMMMGAWDRAGSLLRKAEQANPDDPAVLNDLGVVLYNLDKPDEALTKFQRLLELDPTDYKASYNIGLLYKYALNDPEKARRHLQAVIDSAKADEASKAGAREELSKPVGENRIPD